jgi:hypothetical protein
MPKDECSIDLGRRSLLAIAGSLPLIAALSRAATEKIIDPKAMPKGHIADFDFLVGHWRVRHQALVAGSTTWREYEGQCSMQKVLGGQANVDDNFWQNSSGSYRALSVRAFDPEHHTWSIFWLDSRFPGTLGPPVIGGFDGNRGLFYGDDSVNGKAVRVRFRWFVESSSLCRWEQAYSSGDERIWETNWRMRFERIADRAAPAAKRNK